MVLNLNRCYFYHDSLLPYISLQIVLDFQLSRIFCTISLLFLKFMNKCSDIVMNEFYIYSPSVNGLPCLTISRAATKLAYVVEFADLIHLLN